MAALDALSARWPDISALLDEALARIGFGRALRADGQAAAAQVV